MAIIIRVKLMGGSTISKFIALVCFQGFIYPYLQSLKYTTFFYIYLI